MSDPLIRCSLHDYAVKPANMINNNNKILSVVLILSIKLPPRVKRWAVCFEVCQDKESSGPSVKEGIENLGFEILGGKKELSPLSSPPSPSKKPILSTYYVPGTMLCALFILCLNLKLTANLLLTMVTDWVQRC